MTVRTRFRATIPLLCLTLIVGCSDSSTSSSGEGQIRLTLVDAPAAFDEVNIVVTKVEVHAAGTAAESGWITLSDTTATYDLLELTNGANSVIGDHMLPVGKYTQIRLGIGTGSNVIVDGVSFPLNVASASGLKLNHNFDIAEDKLYLLTLDFDAAKSVRLTNDNQYRLQPVIRLIATEVSGTIYGTIVPNGVSSTVFAGVGNGDTVTTVSNPINGSFMLVAVPEGTFDVVIVPNIGGYLDTTITDVLVEAQQDRNIGTVILTTTP